ncbi:hypothetical protein BVRB_5g126980 [Beta vulgaris subsp. vulgaris]|uniref:Uncharacterized protein n=1 Tax=Beta vulgaris subsp. vulgaris TaxID=3555 RepID=A0A0J8B8Z7_BETVV|nr:hypothetical protein BVRB_5g126980 [Beta vulgaris subsp. vulgaris]
MSVEVLESGEISPTQGDDSPAPKNRKTSDQESDNRTFTEKTTTEKATLFDSTVRRFISRPDIKAIRALSEEEEVEQFHSSWIDNLEAEKKRWAEEKVALKQKIQDTASQRDSVARTQKLIIEEWKTSKAGRMFAANMGMESVEIATREAVAKLRDAVAKLREALKKIHPSADWERVEEEYNAAINAELQVDDNVDIGDVSAEDIPLIEGVPSTVEAPIVSREEAYKEDLRERQNSSDHTSSESDDEEDDGELDVPETSDSDTSSSSAIPGQTFGPRIIERPFRRRPRIVGATSMSRWQP